jgi:CarD family transcriptional regulator
MHARFAVGDKAYYPVHGVAEVVGLEQRDYGGTPASVYVLKIVETGLKIMVPTTNADTVGLRALLKPGEIKEIYAILRSKGMSSESQTWNRRHREYMDKIKTGSAFEIAEVLRDLSRLRGAKDLSFGEKRMLESARSLLVKEIAMTTKATEPSVQAEIAEIFASDAAA